jgi:acyl-CoA thioesterase-1
MHSVKKIMLSKKTLAMAIAGVMLVQNALANDLELICPSDAPLKNILIIGDSVSKCYSSYICEYMPKDYAVFHNKNNALDSSSGRRRLDLWIDKRHWDLVYFNFGLHDIIHDRAIDKSCKDVSCKLQRTSVESYKANLKSILFSVKQYSSNVVYALTTPFLPDVKDSFWVSSDVPLYNAIAIEIMEGQGVPIDDLYSVVISNLQKIQVKQDVHFTPEGCKTLASRVAQTISGVLK